MFYIVTAIVRIYYYISLHVSTRLCHILQYLHVCLHLGIYKR